MPRVGVKDLGQQAQMDFATVLREERRILFSATSGESGALQAGAAARAASDPDSKRLLTVERQANLDDKAAALCLSGGGVRSASFCIGVLTGLSRSRLLSKFHYLSTVSGGGYAGSLVSALAYREPDGIVSVETELANETDGRVQKHLRENISFLSPRRGIFSVDSWTLIGTFLRNLLLHWLILLPLLAALILLPHVASAPFDTQFRSWFELLRKWIAPPWTIFVVGVLGASMLVRLASSNGGTSSANLAGQWRHWLAMTILGVGSLPILVTGPLKNSGPGFIGSSFQDLGELVLLNTVGAALYTLWWLARTLWRGRASVDVQLIVGAVRDIFQRNGGASADTRQSWQGMATLALRAAVQLTMFWLCSFVVLLILYGLIELIPLNSESNSRTSEATKAIMVFGVPVLLAVFWAGEILFHGLASWNADDQDREWWSRSFAWALIVTAAWPVLIGIAWYSPVIIDTLASMTRARLHAGPKALSVIFSLALIGATIMGASYVCSLAILSLSENSRSRTLLATRSMGLAGKAVCVGLLMTGIAALAVGIEQEVTTQGTPDFLKAASGFGILIALSTLLSLAVNINRFSLHSMYRERLIRTFLGATRQSARQSPLVGAPVLDPIKRVDEAYQFKERQPNAFTQFDRHDNPALHWLDPSRHLVLSNGTPNPIHLINCALNLNAEKDNALQERKAESFVFSPVHCGSESIGYVRAQAYGADAGGISLGTAMTISGAAVSPNAGRFSSPLLTFVLMLLNARLGWWLGNPRYPKAVAKLSPVLSVLYLLKELFGITDSKSRFVYLSDGGHFDNLGVYEAVKRGCKYIVAIDGGADAAYEFSDLGSVIRRVRSDFGIQIERAGDWRIGPPSLAEKGRTCARFNIGYMNAWNTDQDGTLLYFKPCFFTHPASDTPLDVLTYSASSPDFPHESTANQFFTESQFESYRALGAWAIDSVGGNLDGITIDSVEKFFAVASSYISGGSK